LFANPVLANAALDGLAHRAIVVTITGRSYRLAHHPDRADRPDHGEEPDTSGGKEVPRVETIQT
jgi:hypothetical protein